MMYRADHVHAVLSPLASDGKSRNRCRSLVKRPWFHPWPGIRFDANPILSERGRPVKETFGESLLQTAKQLPIFLGS